MRYSLLLNSYEAEPGAIDPEMAKQFMAAFDLYAKDLEKAGVLVAAEILQPSVHSTTLTLRHGHLQIQDGPFKGNEAIVKQVSPHRITLLLASLNLLLTIER